MPTRIRARPTILVRPGEAIPFGRPYRTHPNGPRKLLTARKRVGPFPARRLAWRRISHRSSDHHSSPDFTSDSSSSSSSSNSSSDISSESSPDSSSERSLDSSSPSAGPSRKRCRFPTTLVPSSTPISRPIAPALADLLSCKRFRDSYSSEVSREEHMEIGTANAETVADLGISKGVGARTKDGIDLGVEVATSDIREDGEEFEAEASAGGTMEVTVDPLVNSDISEPTGGDTPDLKGTLYDISHYMSEVPLDRIIEFETTQRRLEAGRENLRVRALLYVKSDRVDSLRHHMATFMRSVRQLVVNENGNGNKNGGGNGNRNHNENDRDARPVIRECTYQDFMKCQPLNFKGTKGVVRLIRWFEKMETVFHISNCPEKYQVKYATYTLLNSALTWWNSHKRTIGTDAAFAMS
ncbi:hypothetical protein Tco_0312360 [Tanacetum coccineum]